MQQTSIRAAFACAAASLLIGAAPATTPQQVIDAAPATAWQAVSAEDMVLMRLGDGTQVVLQLAPAFAPAHVAAIRALVRAGRFDGGAIVRVQDGYVVQWAVREQPVAPTATGPAAPKLSGEYEMAEGGMRFRPLGYRDTFAGETGHVAGWPVARQGGRRWMVHCYGMIGVARDNAPDTGDGTELYAVIGQAPRQLDRNITLVGRVLAGIEHMTSRPRGTEALGFYKTPAERMPILSARIAADMPTGERPAYELLDTESPSFAEWVKLRANRKDAFYVRPAGAIDVCNAQPPVRARP